MKRPEKCRVLFHFNLESNAGMVGNDAIGIAGVSSLYSAVYFRQADVTGDAEVRDKVILYPGE